MTIKNNVGLALGAATGIAASIVFAESEITNVSESNITAVAKRKETGDKEKINFFKL